MPGQLLLASSLAAIAPSAAASAACPWAQPVGDVEWTGPSLQHGFVAPGTAAACAAWCCELKGCATWSLLTDSGCWPANGSQCCMGWPDGRGVYPRDGAGAVSARVDGKKMPALPAAWPKHPTWEPTWDMARSTAMMPWYVRC